MTMVALQVAVFPQSSVAVEETVVVPMLKNEPGAMLYVNAGEEQSSLAVAA